MTEQASGEHNRLLKIDSMEPGQTWQLTGRGDDGKEKTVDFQIVETGWYPSSSAPAVLFRGARVRTDEGLEDTLPFLTLEFAQRVTEAEPIK